jgi:four helix bundle protein
MEQRVAIQERGFRRLIAWQRADDLSSAVYKMANSIPVRDQWLRTQLLKATRSVAANIAEGHGRGTLRDYVHFLEIAISSLNEVENDLHFLMRNEIVPSTLVGAVEPIRLETGKVLAGLLQALRAKLKSNGDWQRRQISDPHEEYGAGSGDWDFDDL